MIGSCDHSSMEPLHLSCYNHSNLLPLIEAFLFFVNACFLYPQSIILNIKHCWLQIRSDLNCSLVFLLSTRIPLPSSIHLLLFALVTASLVSPAKIRYADPLQPCRPWIHCHHQVATSPAKATSFTWLTAPTSSRYPFRCNIGLFLDILRIERRLRQST